MFPTLQKLAAQVVAEDDGAGAVYALTHPNLPEDINYQLLEYLFWHNYPWYLKWKSCQNR